jgi:hypothetical protein
MTDDLKLPTVGEMTFPQWQEWLVHYNALLLKRGRRIEKLEAALAKVAEGYETEWSTSSVTNLLDIAQILSERIVIARKALEKNDE